MLSRVGIWGTSEEFFIDILHMLFLGEASTVVDALQAWCYFEALCNIDVHYERPSRGVLAVSTVKPECMERVPEKDDDKKC